MTKYKLPFILDGKEFNLPKMTVLIHEEAMDDMVQYGKMDETKYSRLFNKHLILKVLQKIDEKTTIDHINEMHPDDYIELFGIVWNSGRLRKSDTKFR